MDKLIASFPCVPCLAGHTRWLFSFDKKNLVQANTSTNQGCLERRWTGRCREMNREYEATSAYSSSMICRNRRYSFCVSIESCVQWKLPAGQNNEDQPASSGDLGRHIPNMEKGNVVY
jgi:hypothetical protein